jgi:stage II sporulation protein D
MPHGRRHWQVGCLAVAAAGWVVAGGCVRQTEEAGASGSGRPPLVTVRLADRAASVTVAVHCGYRVLAGRGGRQVIESVAGAMPAATVFADAAGIRVGSKTYAGEAIEIVPDRDGWLQVGSRHYRGSLQLIRQGGGVTVVNVVDAEKYLAGVVPGEMPSGWRPAALRAQAVAARTYALYQRMHAPADRVYQLQDGQMDQVYKGCDGETRATSEAVADTRGLVLTCDGRIFKAYFSSTCGGITASAAEVLGYARTPPLAGGVQCPYCRQVAEPRRFGWTASVNKHAALAALRTKYPTAFADFREPYRVSPVGRSVTGGPLWLDFADASGRTARLRAGDFRLAVGPSNVLSVNATVVDAGGTVEFRDGRGWGHGAGLCQCGAEGMARQGQSYGEILRHYYPGARLTRVY